LSFYSTEPAVSNLYNIYSGITAEQMKKMLGKRDITESALWKKFVNVPPLERWQRFETNYKEKKGK